MDNVIVKSSPIHGKGLFAAVNFNEGTLILERDDSWLVTDLTPLPDGEHEYHCDWLADGRVVLAQEPERYTNHSCDPNAFVKEVDGVRYCCARRGIAAGEEITYDYCINGFGDTVWECNCGSERCRRTIHSDFFHLPRHLQIEYLPYLSSLYKERFREKVDELTRAAGQSRAGRTRRQGQ
jgi:hypothetical protein